MKKQVAIRQSDIYKEMQLTPEILRSIRTLCGVCLENYIHSKRFRVLLVPRADRCKDTCTLCQVRRGNDYIVMPKEPPL